MMRSIRLGILTAAATLGLTAAFVAAPQPAGTPAAQMTPASPAGSSLNYEVFKTRIEPVFLKDRGNGVRCYNCHSVLPTRLRLQPLSPGATSWTDEQSRENFEVVSQLVTPGEPMKSRLLLHPLAPDAGGDPTHTGGKFWKSTDDPEWQMIADWVRSASGGTSTAAAAGPSLDYEFFKTRVEPIFLQKRPNHARCYVCHSIGNRQFKLVKLDPGKMFWTEEESRQNFKNVLQVVVPGNPTESTLLMHPLAPEAGGEPFHSGGRQFSSEQDPDWMTMAEWVRGEKANGSSGQSAKAQ
jgi:hypothetical protein